MLSNRPFSIYYNSDLAPRLGEIKQTTPQRVRGWGINTVCLVLFPEASEPSLNVNISKMMYCNIGTKSFIKTPMYISPSKSSKDCLPPAVLVRVHDAFRSLLPSVRWFPILAALPCTRPNESCSGLTVLLSNPTDYETKIAGSDSPSRRQFHPERCLFPSVYCAIIWCVKNVKI